MFAFPEDGRLSQSCLQTLYIGSFFVYVVNNAADWLHTYRTGTNHATIFELKDWVVWLMIGSSTLGSIFTFLVFFLCLETAFRNRGMDIEPYRGGCALIFGKLFSWVMDLNCFRLSFLILVFEDAPMTFVNYWLLSACTVPAKADFTAIWPQVLSCLSTIASLGWRATMTIYAYKHIYSMRTYSSSHDPLTELKRDASGQSSLDDVRSVLGITSRRPNVYDECWPIRYSLSLTFPKDPGASSSCDTSSREQSDDENPTTKTSYSKCSPFKPCSFAIRGCGCFAVCSLLYFVLFGACCGPCIYHYTCRRNAYYHRQKFARSCVKNTSAGFYVFTLVFTVTLMFALFAMNGIYISSAYMIGNNHLPPGIRYACAFVDERRHVAFMFYNQAYAYRQSRYDLKGYCFELATSFSSHDNSISLKKPLPDGYLYLNLKRNYPTMRPLMYYYYAFWIDNGRQCMYNNRNQSTIRSQKHILPWPYWFGCTREEPIYRLDLSADICNRTSYI